ncbi:hypothetical protein ACIQXF_04680 [Lysinibacillus sp. NPDC097231]|uniref:hypothetical protein n=1 Tax=Lysinibacillus sp. NPDC097231 TaxID=3364142 RepID=UPI0038017E81
MEEAIDRIAYIVDDNGFVIDSYVVSSVDEYVDGNVIVVRPPIDVSFYKRKWDGSKWVEGETAEERAERESKLLIESLKPTPSEISDAELEIKILTTLTELGVIQ